MPKVDLLFSDLGYENFAIANEPLVALGRECRLGLHGWCVGDVDPDGVPRYRARRPHLIDAMKQVENGELDNRLKISGTDEYAELYRGFNLMTESLREEVQILELSHDLAGELDLDRPPCAHHWRHHRAA